MLELHAEELWRERLHHHEHDERADAAVGVRGGHRRRGQHVCAATGLGTAERAGGLEQQLRQTTADKCVFFHCGNWAKDFLPDIRIGTAPILGTVLGEENTVGALQGRTPAGPVTFGRVSTDDLHGKIRAYVGEGSSPTIRWIPLAHGQWCTFRGLQRLMRAICRNGLSTMPP